jgi:diguanylate cyclase (GGDEF)-like protein/PAS domain S-box-containing protein
MVDLNLIGAPAYALEPAGDCFRYVGINSRLEMLTGLRADRMIGRTPFECLPTAIAERVVQRFRHCMGSREALEYEEHYDLPGGARWWAITLTPVIDPLHQRVTALIGIAVDITRRRNAELAHEEAAARLSLAMDVIDGGFWHLDVAASEFRTSLPLAALMAGDESPALGLDEYLSFIVPDDLPAADLSALVSGHQDEAVVEYRIKTFAGETKWMRCKRRLIRDEQSRPVRIVGVAIDVTEQKALQARYKQQATTDVLTGLANRRSLEVRAQDWLLRARATGRPFGLLLLDLDRFKPVNDRFGHAAGDAVLREVALRLSAMTREHDIVARLGGDEFAILLDDVDDHVLRQMSRAVVKAVALPVMIGGHALRIGVSVGATALEADDGGLEDMALRADRALYQMKAGTLGLQVPAARSFNLEHIP